MPGRPLVIVLVITMLVMSACGRGSSQPESKTPGAGASAAPSVPAMSTAAVPSSTAQPSPAPTSTAAPGAAEEPVGYPLEPTLPTDEVTGATGARSFAIGQGETVRETSERLQVSSDAIEANRDGWDCRVHVEYESSPAVDWYVQPGQPVRATMDGDATLIINTVVNAFDYYGVSREPYIGNPDRARAPVSPFAGPGGGMGIYASVTNDRYRTDYGHLSLVPTIANVPASAFAAGFSRTFDYAAAFATPRAVSAGDVIATWHVHRGDVIGFTGDSGYSEAPHLHYAITDRSSGRRLCPTSEPGFTDAGWLSRGA